MTRTPLEFECMQCGALWAVPPHICCPKCGPMTPAKVPPQIWEVGQVPNQPILISANLRDLERLKRLVTDYGVCHFIDISNDPNNFLWHPSYLQLKSTAGDRGVAMSVITGLDDTLNKGLDVTALERAVLALQAAVTSLRCYESQSSPKVLVHCAAGLRRAPHVVYAYLRKHCNQSKEDAWKAVETARPFAFPHQPYLDSIEQWLVR